MAQAQPLLKATHAQGMLETNVSERPQALCTLIVCVELGGQEPVSCGYLDYLWRLLRRVCRPGYRTARVPVGLDPMQVWLRRLVLLVGRINRRIRSRRRRSRRI